MSGVPGVSTMIAYVPAIDETIWADGDDSVSQWEDEGGATTNIYQSVDSDSDADYATLQVVVLNATRAIRFTLADPSAEPSEKQTVEYKVKFEYIQVDQPLDNAPTAVMNLKEGATTRASRTGITVTQTPTEYSDFLSQTEINSITDWNNLLAEISFTTSGNGVDQDVNYRVYRVRVIFTP